MPSLRSSPLLPALRSVAGALALVALVVAACSTSSGGSPYPDRVRLPSMEVAYTLPTESCGDFFVAPVMLNGRGPWDFLLDSGAGRTLIDPEVAREAGLARRIDSLAIGEYEAFDVGWDRLDTSELGAALRRPIAGILGHPVFGGTLLTWDFPRGAIEVRAGDLPAGAEDVLATRADLRPFVRGRVDGRPRWVLIDTGSSRGLTLRGATGLPMVSPMQTTGARVRVDGVHLVETGRLRGTAEIGPMRVHEPVVSNSVSVDLVGQEVLRFFRITFDQRNDRIRFERPDTAVAVPVESAAVRTMGYALRPDTAWAEVIHIFREGHGLEVGDRIVEVDGLAWRDRRCPAPAGGPVVDPRADTVELRVLRRGERLTLRVPSWVVHPRTETAAR